jgi:hypothetical protein
MGMTSWHSVAANKDSQPCCTCGHNFKQLVAPCPLPLLVSPYIHPQVTDAGLAVAAMRMPRLQVLYLSYCRQIGDPGLEHVLQMGRLEELDLYNTPCVSAAAVARMAR